MALSAGTKLGPYEILALIGAGGMGEVYRARDPRLNRDVAIKVSQERFSDRFEREARAAAALNHPNICHIYDVGPDYLVMELVEGKELGRGLPLPDALRYAIQIADALDAAHRKGIVHRDLKPANILVTKTGLKLLDFGLAKMAQHAVAADGATATIALTAEKTILGTLEYMSPEQLRGAGVDARSDLFAFGSVLYEMLAGRRAFPATDSATTIARILTAEPAALDAVGGAIPPALDRLMRKCLAKDANDRWQCAGDLKQALAWIAEDQGFGSAAPMAPRRRGALTWIAAAIFCGLLAVAVMHWRETPAPPEVTRFTLPGPGRTARLSLSPDGRKLAYVSGTKIVIRFFDTLEPRALNGTDGAGTPFWSPDSKSVAFVSSGKLKRIDVAGGPIVTLGDAGTNIQGDWGPDGTILIGLVGDGIFRVPASGGKLTRVTKLDASREESRHLLPKFLPGGRAFLYTAGSNKAGTNMLYAASLDSAVRTPIIPVESNATFVATAPGSARGYLLFVRERTLFAQPFDAASLNTTGEASPVAEPIYATAALGANLQIAAFSANGSTLVYNSFGSGNAQLTWFNRSGSQAEEIGPLAQIGLIALFADGKRCIASIADANGTSDLWLVDGVRGTSSRLTFDRNFNTNPVLSPDGSRVAYAAYRAGVRNIFQVSTAGTGAVATVLESEFPIFPMSWSQDGGYLAYAMLAPATNYDVWVLPEPLGRPGVRKPFPVVQSAAVDAAPRFSPDGKWLAYVSDESGKLEVYVQPFAPGKPASGKWQISVNGADAYHPEWRGDGKEMYFICGGKVMAVEVGVMGDRFQAGVPKPLFSPRGTFRDYAVTSDGQRFLLSVAAQQQAEGDPFKVVQNWMAGAKK